MKKLIPSLIMVIFSLGAQYAFAQVKNDFSDWNVPPPLPPGTIPKGQVTNKAIGGQAPVDIPAPAMPILANVRLAALSPVLLTPLNIPAPDQPKFPELPFAVPDIPLPQVPDALALPKHVPPDEINEGATDMPTPDAPEMPPLPKIPDAGQSKPTDEVIRLPLAPVILNQPDTGALPVDSFPFLEWPVPELPSGANSIFILPQNLDGSKVKPGKVKKSVKKNKGKR